jgi:hypothetical protein
MLISRDDRGKRNGAVVPLPPGAVLGVLTSVVLCVACLPEMMAPTATARDIG